MVSKNTRASLAGLACLLATWPALAQQLPDRDYRPPVENPTWPTGEGPTVCLDEAHNNFHTLENRFWAFGELLRRDGYVVVPNTEPLSAAGLARCEVLVISNASFRTAAGRPIRIRHRPDSRPPRSGPPTTGCGWGGRC